MTRFRPLLVALSAACGMFALALPANACGGLFCSRIPVNQTGEKILFASDGRMVTAHVQIQYQGEANKFGWILPVPTPPKLSVGTDAFFAQLSQATQPQFQLAMSQDGPCEPQPMREYAPSASGAERADKGVTVLSQEQVGPYDTVVLQANDTGVLVAWLRKNDYVIPAKLDPLLDPYVAGKYSFVALKLTKNKAAGDIQPIVLTYKATKASIPIRLTGVAATPNMNIFVWVLGARRAVPENFRHVRINEARIDWLSGGSNYKDVVTRAVAEAGGQAFVTNYAGPTDVVSPERFSRAHFKLGSLALDTDPVEFAQAVADTGFFGERYGAVNGDALVAFLKRYIRKPHSLAHVDDTSFYRFIDQHAEALHEAGIKVNTTAAIAELEARVVRPSEHVAQLLGRFPYLTALYTTMSPADMTQDPSFRFNPRLGNVAVVRKATGVRHCIKGVPYFETPIEITLANGRHFMAHPNRGPFGEGGLPALPAAEAIEQLNPVGAASIIQDNGVAIASALAARPAPGTVDDWAEGGGVLGGILLLAGWRSWRKRDRNG